MCFRHCRWITVYGEGSLCVSWESVRGKKLWRNKGRQQQQKKMWNVIRMETLFYQAKKASSPGGNFSILIFFPCVKIFRQNFFTFEGWRFNYLILPFFQSHLSTFFLFPTKVTNDTKLLKVSKFPYFFLTYTTIEQIDMIKEKIKIVFFILFCSFPCKLFTDSSSSSSSLMENFQISCGIGLK